MGELVDMKPYILSHWERHLENALLAQEQAEKNIGRILLHTSAQLSLFEEET